MSSVSMNTSNFAMMLDPVHIVMGEIQNVLAAMRLNRRWTTASQNAHQQESPLLQGFKKLMVTLGGAKDLRQMDTLIYVEPFLEVIRSEETSGPITGVALSSMHKFLHGFIRADSPNAPRAMALIAEAVTHCRFEATDPDSDEVILMKILQVLLACIQCHAGLLLTEDVVSEMVQTCFRMTVQTRLSELLRRCAESTLMEMVLYIFSNYNLPPIPTSPAFQNSQEIELQRSATPTITSNTTTTEPGDPLSISGTLLRNSTGSNNNEPRPATPIPPVVQIQAPLPGEEGQPSVLFVNPQGVSFEPLDATRPLGGRPYGIPCLAKIFQFLSSLTDPAKPDSEDIRVLGLSMLISIIEARGPALVEIPEIRLYIQGNLCKFLLISMQTRNIGIFTGVLRLFFNLYLCAKPYLKTHMEAFFTALLYRIVDNKNTSYEQQELALECLVEFCRLPYVTADMYANFDCDLTSSNMLETMCKLLYKNAFPVSGSLYTVHLLSLDGLLAMVQSIHERLPQKPYSGQPTSTALRYQHCKLKKNLLTTAAEHFNRNPKEGFEFLKANKMLPDPIDPRSVAVFLKTTPRLDKALVGTFLGKRDPFNISVTAEYAQLFDFPTQQFHVCVRHFLETFRIPGESQIIERILEPFAKAYFSFVTSRGENLFSTTDVVYLLVYSTVLLNVDQHSPNVKHRMTLDDFVKNIKNIPDSNLIPREFISALYHGVRSQEIRIPEEFPTGEITTVTFEDLLRRARRATEYVQVESTDHDRDIFAILWGPIIAAISVVFDTTEDPAVLAKAINGFHVCAAIASYYVFSDVLDNLVISLCKFSTLLAPPGENPLITFGRDTKAQQATLAVFKITRQHADFLREGWRNVLNCLISLHQMDMLDSLQDMVVDFEGTPSIRTSTGADASTHTKSHASLLSPFGLLGTAAWFGGGGGDQFDSEPSEEEKAAEEGARKIVVECNVRDIILGTKDLRSDSLVYLVKALILASVRPKKKPTTPTASSTSLPTLSSSLVPNSTERVALFCLNLLTHITLINHERIILFWALVRDHLYSFISTPPASHASPSSPPPVVLLEKAIFSLLYLCIHLAHKQEMTEQLLKGLQAIVTIDTQILERIADKLMSALLRLCEKNGHLVPTPLAYTSIFQLVTQVSTSTPLPTQQRALDVIDSLLSSPGFLSPESFPLVLRTLTDFSRSTRPSHVAIAAMRQMDRLFSMVLPFLGLSLEEEEPKHEQAFNSSPTPTAEPSSKAKQFLDRANKRKRDEKKKEAWSKYWQPILLVLSDLCRDTRGDVRNNAMTHLQRALLSPYLAILTPQGWFICFEEVVFPLLRELLLPQEMDMISLEETRLRASVLLSKIFLQHLYTITGSTSFRALWVKILLFIEMYMKAEGSELLAEAVPESLKNVLLVMIASGLFQADTNANAPKPEKTPEVAKVQASEEEKKAGGGEEGGEGEGEKGVEEGEEEDFWTASWQIIDAFCPSLKEDVFAKLGRPLSPSVPVPLPPIPTTPLPDVSTLSPTHSHSPADPSQPIIASPPAEYHLSPPPHTAVDLNPSQLSSPTLLSITPEFLPSEKYAQLTAQAPHSPSIYRLPPLSPLQSQPHQFPPSPSQPPHSPSLLQPQLPPSLLQPQQPLYPAQPPSPTQQSPLSPTQPSILVINETEELYNPTNPNNPSYMYPYNNNNNSPAANSPLAPRFAAS